MTRAFTAFFSLCLVLSACTQRTVCPAFQSAFIYDQDALRKKFSYFQNDTTPKVLTASKTKYLIAEPVSYQKKLNSLQTIEMKDINPVVPDSLTEEGDVSLAELDSAARSVIDSIYIVDLPQPAADSAAVQEDSVYMISKDKEVRMLRFNKDSLSYRVDELRFNTDQDNYMWYLRDVLVLPDVRLAKLQGEAREAAKNKKERKGIRGFFKNLFKNKKKQAELDSILIEPKEQKSEFDFDYNDMQHEEAQDSVEMSSTTVEEEAQDAEETPQKVKKKKNKKAKKKKKEEAPPTEEPEPVLIEEPEKKEEEDDGGF